MWTTKHFQRINQTVTNDALIQALKTLLLVTFLWLLYIYMVAMVTICGCYDVVIVMIDYTVPVMASNFDLPRILILASVSADPIEFVATHL